MGVCFLCRSCVFCSTCIGVLEMNWEKMQSCREDNKKLRTALDKAVQLADRCTDWNFDEAEIDGKMRSVYTLKSYFTKVLQKC